MSAETFQFQAESRKLLDLMIHSIYTNKEIFLRELISNASDAMDKLRVESLTKPELLDPGDKMEIRLEYDKNLRTLSIIDNGIGMNKEDLVSHIGTIARSGTQEFVNKLKENKSAESINEMIGQFGVGFYSAFMIADQIKIQTRKAGENTAYEWTSMGDGEYSITETDKKSHGTTIILYLKPVDSENGLEDFTDPYEISRIVKKYSDFINYPIILKEEREEVEKDKDGKPVKDGKKTTVIEDKTLNSMKPIWVRNSSEVTNEEYTEFYKHISHDWNEPLKTISYKAEGTIEYHSLLFVPSKAPFDFYYQGYKSGLQLYVKKVMIMEAFEDLLPKYLRFMKGVVESSDLPLNISRETLQQDRRVMQMKKNLTKKTLDSLQEMFSSDKEKYLTFWKEFGDALKEGITSDFENKEKLSGMLMFESSNDPEKLSSLDEYIERMKEGQEDIYYITGEARSILENSPHLEALKEKGYEVLFMTRPVDEIVVQYLTEYKTKKIKSAGKGKIDIGTKEEKEKKEKEIKEKSDEFSDLLKFIGEKLSGTIKEVRLSSRLISAPACIVGDEYDMSMHLERLLQKDMGTKPATKRILEVNPGHNILVKMNQQFKQDKDSPVLSDYAELLYGYAVLSEGGILADPVKFNRIVVSLMEKAI